MALPVLTHRVMLSPEARMKGVAADRVIAGLLETTQVPVRVP